MDESWRKPTHLAVYHAPIDGLQVFEVRLGQSPEFPRETTSPITLGQTFTLVAAKKIPSQMKFELPIATPLELRDRLGGIKYRTDPKTKTAKSTDYYPKGFPPVNSKKLGYFIEAITTTKLKNMGYLRIVTSSTPSHLRKAQLAKAGLPVGKKKPVDKWLEGMGSGIKGNKPTILQRLLTKRK